MISVTYLLELREPVLARTIDGDPNSGVSATFLPGSMIRGVVALLVGRTRTGRELAVDERALLFDDSVRYLNAYPADEQGRRTLPAPMSWRHEKNDPRTVFAGYDEAVLALDSEPAPDDLEEIGGYVGAAFRDDGDDGALPVVRTYRPRLQLALHTQRSRQAGRATRGDGSIFQIEALAAGQRFAGAILTHDRATAERIRTLLHEKTIFLGGSATAGYGRAVVEQVTIDENWAESDGQVTDLAAGAAIIVTTLSDTLLRDAAGVAHTDLPAALALPFATIFARKRTHPVGAFNRKWGLPTPQAQALQAGSVFVLRATAPVSAAALQQRIDAGIGERRSDGCGRFAVNWQDGDSSRFLCRSGVLAAALPGVGADLNQAAPAVADMARRMATRRRQQQLDAALVDAILDGQLAIHRPPPNSQLARVRVYVRSAMQSGSLRAVAALFDEGKPGAFQAKALGYFRAARITDDKQELGRWLGALAQEPEQVWRWMPPIAAATELGKVAPDANLAVQYAGRLIDGVLERAMKQRNRQGKGGNDEGAS